jgi:hypothetical protein
MIPLHIGNPAAQALQQGKTRPIKPTNIEFYVALYKVSKYATTILSTTLLSGRLPATP